MNKLLISLFLVFFSGLICNSQSAKENSTTSESSTEQEIRAVLCDIENKNYSNARISLEQILQKDPQNVYAQRLLPGVSAQQIKNDDQSLQNTAKIKDSVEKFENFLKKSEVSTNERLAVNDFIISLIQMMPDSQKETEFLKRAENIEQIPQIRSKHFTALAARSHKCADDITESVKKIVSRNGQEIYVFSKPEKNVDFERLNQCAEKGTGFIEQAIGLDSRSEIAWSYKASLLIQKMRIAEMEGKTAEKDIFNKELETAREKFFTLSDEKRKAYSEKPLEISEEKPDLDKIKEEFTSYKIERPVSALVEELYIPFEKTFVEPFPLEDTPEESDSKSKINEKIKKRGWKLFSPENDEFTAELPDNAELSTSSNGIVTYEAGDENLDFRIMSQSRSEIQTPDLDDAVLNIIARSFIIPSGNLLMLGNSAGSFEVKLVRKENFSGFPARFYAYALNSCTGKKEGVMIFMTGKTKNYSIMLSGVNERDPRAQRFLKSWKIAGK